MSDDPLSADSTADAKAEVRAAEAAAIRRRWITLGELLAVLAVVISALTLWNSWSERSQSAAEKSSDERRASKRAVMLVLTATGAGKSTLALRPAAAEQSVQSQTVLFPTALALSPTDTTGEPRIEARWFDHALLKAREKAGMPDNSRGDERLPVVITTRFLIDGAAHEDVALYDVGYSVSGRFLAGHSVTLRGLSMVARVKSDGAQHKLDARWRQLFPGK